MGPSKRHFSAADKRRMRKLYLSGLSINEVALRMKCGHTLIGRMLNELGIVRGHASPTRLSKEQRREVATAYRADESIESIADRLNCSPSFIAHTLRTLKVHVRAAGGNSRQTKFSKAQAMHVKAQYLKRVSIHKIARQYGCSYKVLYRLLARIGVKRFPPGWKGGKIKDATGYVRIYMPDHPFANGTYVLEHRLVMEKKLGRYLDKHEVVHHRNGIKHDNRPSNLQVLTRKTHHGTVCCPKCRTRFLIK
jgi:transposase-like protein